MKRILMVVSLAALVAAMLAATAVAQEEDPIRRSDLLGPISPSGGVDCQGEIFDTENPVPHGEVTIDTQAVSAGVLVVTVHLEGGDPNTTYSIEIFEATPNCGSDNNAAKHPQATLTTDGSGSGATAIAIPLPYSTLGGEAIGDGQGSEQLVVVLDQSLSTAAGGDRFVGVVSLSGEEGSSDPAKVTLTPADSVGEVGTNSSVTATVEDESGQPIEGVKVRFSVEGAVNTTGECTTDAQGKCSFTFDGPSLPGAVQIDAYADTDNNGTRDEGEPEATEAATRAFVLPTSTPGQVTGGGQIPTADGKDKIAFGFNAKSTTNESNSTDVKGDCTLVDPSTDTKIECLDVASLVQGATHATLFGKAEVTVGSGDQAEAKEVNYRIDIDDLADPGKDKDTFKIQTASGYTASGTLKGGNILMRSR